MHYIRNDNTHRYALQESASPINRGKIMHWLTWIGLLFIAIGTAFTILGQQRINDKSNQLLQNKTDRMNKLQ
jgi:hypothetical protein